MAGINGTRLPRISSMEELAGLVAEVGFLPAFRCAVPGFSAEECIAPEHWFSEGEGFWEWKGPVIRLSGCAYGKLLGGRAAFVMPDWYRELANYRRNGYDFDALWDEGLAGGREKQVFDVLWERGSLLSKELNRVSSGGEKRRDFDAVMTRLQMRCYAVISNFEYEISRSGSAYGWGVTRYETPEHRFGPAFTEAVYSREPEESGRILLERLGRLLPDVQERWLRKLIG